MTSPLNSLRLKGIALAAVIFGADQVLKHYVVETLGLRQIGDHYGLLPIFDFTRTNNYGFSLGMFQATSMEMRWAQVALTVGIAIGVVVWILREVKGWDIFGLSLILGGACGNIVDRYRFGYVVDFLDLHFGTFRPFLIFNLADVAITFGVVILLYRALFMGEKSATEQDQILADQSRGDQTDA